MAITLQKLIMYLPSGPLTKGSIAVSFESVGQRYSLFYCVWLGNVSFMDLNSIPVRLGTNSLVAMVLVLATVACSGAPRLLTKSKSSDVVLAVVRTSAWANSPLLEVPPFVLYGDGTAIYTRDGRYWTTKLTPSEVQNIWLRLERAEFFEVPAEITLTPNWTDQDVGRIAAHTNQGWRMVRIYNPDVEPKGCSRINAIRTEFLRLNEFITEKEERWLPEELGVYLNGYSNSRGPNIPWPEGLTAPPKSKLPPDHSDDAEESTSYFYRIPPREQQVLANLLVEQARRDQSAVVVGGKKWAIYFVPYIPRIGALYKALEKYSDWPWGFEYGDAPTQPCKKVVVDVKWGALDIVVPKILGIPL